LRGFTLIELMVVVAIVGVLSMLCLYTVRTYAVATKTTEARNSLGQIGKDAAAAFERETMTASILGLGQKTLLARSLCKSASASVPSTTAMIRGAKYQSLTSDWSVDAVGNSGFACLKFVMDQPQYYLYSYTSTGNGSSGATFTAAANGDLNGDGVLSTYSLFGSVNSGYVLELSPNLQELNSLE
jgi:type IV pilus assembly protein PilA